MSERTSPADLGDVYWATLPDSKIAGALDEKINEYYKGIENNGRVFLWKRAYQLYYGMDPGDGWSNSSAISYGGVQGELALIRVNHFRSLIEHLLVLITGERPSFIARAVNTDGKSQAQTKLAESLLDYFLIERGFEDVANTAAENALLFGEGWVCVSWDPDAGDEFAVDPDTQKIIKTGDVRIRAFEPLDVIRDITTCLNEQKWHIVHSRRNKWDLAARFPEFRDDIIRANSKRGLVNKHRYRSFAEKPSDEVSVYEFFHDRCDSLPDGRYVVMVGDRVVVSGALPYRDYPMHAMVPTPEKRSAFGYSRCWDLMGLQEALDSIASNFLTTHDAFSLPNVWTPKGSDLTVSDIAGGLNHLESNDKPELIDLFSIPDESFRMYDLFSREMQSLVGLNNIVRGKSEENVRTSGQAALMSAQATQFNSKLQEAWIGLLDKISTNLVRVLQRYATEPMLVEISGKKHRPLLKEFTGQDISAVHKVKVELGDSMQRSSAGKLEMAMMLVQLANTRQGEKVTPQQLLQVMLSGKLDPISDRPDSQRRLCQRENEMLDAGIEVKALMTDDHWMHILEHSEPMDDPEVRFDEAALAARLAHIMEHASLWMTTDPNILMATAQEPPQMPPPVAGAMAAGAPPGTPDVPPGMNAGVASVPIEAAPGDSATAAPPVVEAAGLTVPQVPQV